MSNGMAFGVQSRKRGNNTEMASALDIPTIGAVDLVEPGCLRRREQGAVQHDVLCTPGPPTVA